MLCCGIAPVVVRIGACFMHDAAYYIDASQAHPHRLTVFVYPLLAILRNRIGLLSCTRPWRTPVVLGEEGARLLM